MKIVKKGKDGEIYLKIDGAVNIHTTTRLKNVFIDFLEENKKLEIDLADTKVIDSAGFQLFVLIKNYAEMKNKELKMLNTPEPVQDLFKLYRESPMV